MLIGIPKKCLLSLQKIFEKNIHRGILISFQDSGEENQKKIEFSRGNDLQESF
jgi:hypothetical protein